MIASNNVVALLIASVASGDFNSFTGRVAKIVRSSVPVILFSKGGDLKVKNVSAWQMNSIYANSDTQTKQ